MCAPLCVSGRLSVFGKKKKGGVLGNCRGLAGTGWEVLSDAALSLSAKQWAEGEGHRNLRKGGEVEGEGIKKKQSPYLFYRNYCLNSYLKVLSVWEELTYILSV